jgi:hypothetical protein
MTHVIPVGANGAITDPPSASHPLPLTSLGIDQGRLQISIASRREQIALIEADWVAASKRIAARNACHGIRVNDRETWDRPMWDRYLAAATDIQDSYLPRLHRLYDEVARLERLLMPLPASSGRAA